MKCLCVCTGPPTCCGDEVSERSGVHEVVGAHLGLAGSDEEDEGGHDDHEDVDVLDLRMQQRVDGADVTRGLRPMRTTRP